MARDIKFSCCFQFMLWLISMLAGIIQGFQIGAVAGSELSISDEYSGANIGDLHEAKPNTQEREIFVSIYALGAAAGALFGGQACDSLGRKTVTIIGTSLIAMGFIIIIISQDICSGFIGRLVGGIGQGIISFSVPLYLNEVGSQSFNKIIVAVMSLFQGTGMLGGLNLAIPFQHHWKAIYEFGLIPCALLIVIQACMPESQFYYINQGRDDDALEVLKIGLSEEDAQYEIKKLRYEKRFFFNKSVTYGKKCSDIFGGVYTKPFVIAITLASLSQLVGTSAFLYYGPEIIEQSQVDISDAIPRDLSAIIFDNFILGSFTSGNFLSAMVISKLGRRSIVLYILPIAFFSTIGLAYTMHEANYGDEDEQDFNIKEDYKHGDRIMFFVFLILYMFSTAIGLSSTIWGITAEIIPNYLLAQVSSLVTMWSWLLNFAITSCFLGIVDDP